ncbi:MAG: NADH-quinone oxidoreductase subunit NuoN, partial [Pseudomonadota bacterium]|nr:NADH-quinone oxidoreductase subunit NuoN [Pseudomonadota bacterium]
MEFSQLTFSAALPEFVLIALALVMVLVAAFARQTQAEEQGTIKLVRTLSLLGYFAAFLAVFSVPDGRIVLFNDLFAVNDLVIYMKGLILVGAFFASWLVSEQWGEGIDRAEFHLLVLMAVIGMLLMVSANDLISLYMALELQSLPLYVVAAMRTSSLKSSEAGLKYFLLGARSSGLLLYGASLVYGFSGSTNFDAIASSLSGGASVGMVVGMVFLLSGLAFKISAAPFHMWTPDVYEGAPTPVTALFAIVPKVAGMTLLMNVTYYAFGNITDQWVQILIALSVASMIVGATGAIMQQNIKRMLAYSSIAHMGYALAGLAAGTSEGASAVVIYMTTYVFMGAAAFGVIMTMRREGTPVEKISDLSGLSATHPLLAAAMMIVMFSMAGIPPLAGFFGKWYVFLAAVNAGLVPLAVIGVLTSVIGAFYYLRIIKIMYFDKEKESYDKDNSLWLKFSLSFSTLIILLY